jgi:glyoxylase-like metal-dependent hydrolase (beta-lactamase superfamily II)
MPGHTPGTTVAHVTLDRDGAFLLVSDAVAVRENLDRRQAPRVTWDADLAVRSFDEIARIERDGATVILGHDDAQWRGLRKGAAFYE